MKAARLLTAITVATALVTAGCGAPPDELRHELGPLVARFPGIGQPISATWVLWDNNSDRLSGPGPTTSWIDAIVELEPRRAAELLATASNGGTPAVRDALRPHLPPGPFVAGHGLDVAIGGKPGPAQSAASPWGATGFLEQTGNRLVLNGVQSP
ncbi:hypothetical protein [Amycolatopsis sp. H20-H5]|uniref:hypothetical protein n=1 Tax=Amycolatopsis sp. H20-H5 TaxID=3046309 RepID=UPI002DBBF5BB|nr:hypothetical protein [Amycolatopsis sp. H20-H5]MEC3973870.1 hypothetical protein [Amycolatopsis sp. H20-H5]